MESITTVLAQFIAHVKFEKRYSPHTVRSYGDDLAQFHDFVTGTFGNVALQDVSPAYVRSWLASMKESGLNSRSINRKMSTLKSFFRFAMRNGLVTKSPVAAIVTPKVSRRLPAFVEQDDMHTLLQHVGFPDDWKGQTAKLAIRMLYETGIRLSELVGCREAQVDHSGGHIKILGKGNKERVIPVSNGLLEEIRNYTARKRAGLENADTVFLLVNEKGKKLYPKYVYRITTAYLPLVTTIEKNSPHILRHSFATHLSNNGAELNAVKELLGHASLAATQVYTHNSIDKLKNIHKKAHPRG